MFSCLAMSQICSHHILTTCLLSHLTRVIIHVTVTATDGSISLSSNTRVWTRFTWLSWVATAAIVRQFHTLHTVLDHEIAEVDVGSAVIATDHVRRLVTMVITVGQTRVILTFRPVNLNSFWHSNISFLTFNGFDWSQWQSHALIAIKTFNFVILSSPIIKMLSNASFHESLTLSTSSPQLILLLSQSFL